MSDPKFSSLFTFLAFVLLGCGLRSGDPTCLQMALGLFVPLLAQPAAVMFLSWVAGVDPDRLLDEIRDSSVFVTD